MGAASSETGLSYQDASSSGGAGRGMGRGGGRGLGCGRGMGMGRGFRSAAAPLDIFQGSAPTTAETENAEDLAALKYQAREMRRQMERIELRIKDLEERAKK
jgi:hypothetical protein